MEFSIASRYNGDFDVMNKVVNSIDTFNLKPVNFTGKITTSVVECPHIFWTKLNQTALANPSTMADTISQVAIDLVKTLNGSVDTRSTTTNLGYGQHLFSFNIIEELDRRLGSWIWKDCLTFADKVAKARTIITNTLCNWHGFGSGPNGNKATACVWLSSQSWASGVTHTSGTVTKLAFNINSPHIQNDGFIHCIAYTDPSNGTVASSISTDYVELVLTLKL